MSPDRPKKWFRVATTTAQYKWAMEFGKFNDAVRAPPRVLNASTHNTCM